MRSCVLSAGDGLRQVQQAGQEKHGVQTQEVRIDA
jgi:hypothetical protein